MKFCICLVVVCTLALPGLAFAATYFVYPEGTTGTIQDAIDILESGDTIIAMPGTYTGPGNRDIDFGGKAITLRSDSGPEVTIIDCEYADRAFLFWSGEGPNTVVDGFTMTRGSNCIVCHDSSPTIANCILTGNSAAQGGGIYCLRSSPTIVSCWIHDNSGTNGGGIYCFDNSNPTILLCTVSANLATYGGGIYCYDYSDPVIAGCWITLNRAGGTGGGVGFYDHSRPTITACWITDNSAGEGGGGVDCGSPTTATIRDTWIASNRTDTGNGGGVRADRIHLVLNNCTISGNTAPVYGGGFSGYQASMELIDSIVCGNKAESDGGGLHLNAYNSAWIINSRITGNTAGRDAGGIYGHASPWISESIISGNKSAGDGGGIFFYLATGQPIASCTIAGNDAQDYGGGIYYDECDAPITNCTIVHNEAYDGGGVFTDNLSFPTLSNCILWGDTPNEVSGSFSNPTLNNCNIQGGWTGDGSNNMNAYPQFIGWPGGTWTSNGAYDVGSWAVTFTDNNADWVDDELVGRLVNPDISQPLQFAIVGNTTTTVTAYVDWQTVNDGVSWVLAGASYSIHDYRLSHPLASALGGITPSPCIDAGDNSAPGLSTLDGDSNHRIWDVGAGWTVDMGAYECGSEPFTFTRMRRTGFGNIELTWNSTGVAETTYDVWYSDDDYSDSMTWSLLQSGIPSGGATTTWTDTTATAAAHRYYKASQAGDALSSK